MKILAWCLSSLQVSYALLGQACVDDNLMKVFNYINDIRSVGKLGAMAIDYAAIETTATASGLTNAMWEMR